MYTVRHEPLEAHTGEPVEIIFDVTDNAKPPQPVLVEGATATYKVARRQGGTALMTLTEINGITLSGNTATVEFDVDDIGRTGDLFGELKITKDGVPLVVGDGRLHIIKTIS